MRALIVGLLTLVAAAPLRAQAPCPAPDFAVTISSGWLNYGKVVREEEYFVRFGNTGNDIYARLGLEGGLTCRLAFSADATAMPTFVYTWQKDTGETISRWFWRPAGGRADPVTLSELTVGARYYATPWLDAGLGVGLETFSGASQLFWGALPGSHWTAHWSLRAHTNVGTHARVGIQIGGYPKYLGRGAYAVLQSIGLVGGNQQRWLSNEIQARRQGMWVWPLYAGISVGIVH